MIPTGKRDAKRLIIAIYRDILLCRRSGLGAAWENMENMKKLEKEEKKVEWKKQFDTKTLVKGYDYYCDGAVEDMDIFSDSIRADVVGTQSYEVEITLNDGKIGGMRCSCPYAADGRRCKHMAAVLYVWSDRCASGEAPKISDDADKDLFIRPRTDESRRRKSEAVRKLVDEADLSVVRSCLASILEEDEKLLIRFHRMVKKPAGREDIKCYKRQVDMIARRYLGRDRFISYQAAYGFVSDLGEVLYHDAERMIGDGQYMSAFELINYIFVLLGTVDVDDSDGHTGSMAEGIYDLWAEILGQVDAGGKQEMFQWFTTHMDGSVVDYMEEYIERIIMEEFTGETYTAQKMEFAEKMIQSSEKKDSEWSRDHYVGKWSAWYLSLLEEQDCGRDKIEDFCRKHWKNTSVRKYYIDRCIRDQNYDMALKTLEESISLDRTSRQLIARYSEQKKEIYLQQGNQKAYVEQLWALLLEHKIGDLEIYRELRGQYSEEEWREQRERIFTELSNNVRLTEFYKEEKLYDRLLECVLKSSGLSTLSQYADILKEKYPEQILQKYREEVDRLASDATDRKRYREAVARLRSIQQLQGGRKVVEEMSEQWRKQYRNRPAFLDELGKL